MTSNTIEVTLGLMVTLPQVICVSGIAPQVKGRQGEHPTFYCASVVIPLISPTIRCQAFMLRCRLFATSPFKPYP